VEAGLQFSGIAELFFCSIKEKIAGHHGQAG
jgi:hypothetical protein